MGYQTEKVVVYTVALFIKCGTSSDETISTCDRITSILLWNQMETSTKADNIRLANSITMILESMILVSIATY